MLARHDILTVATGMETHSNSVVTGYNPRGFSNTIRLAIHDIETIDFSTPFPKYHRLRMLLGM